MLRGIFLRRGVALVFTLSVGVLLVILSISLFSFYSSEVYSEMQQQRALQACWNARAGLEHFCQERHVPQSGFYQLARGRISWMGIQDYLNSSFSCTKFNFFEGNASSRGVSGSTYNWQIETYPDTKYSVSLWGFGVTVADSDQFTTGIATTWFYQGSFDVWINKNPVMKKVRDFYIQQRGAPADVAARLVRIMALNNTILHELGHILTGKKDGDSALAGDAVMNYSYFGTEDAYLWLGKYTPGIIALATKRLK